MKQERNKAERKKRAVAYHKVLSRFPPTLPLLPLSGSAFRFAVHPVFHLCLCPSRTASAFFPSTPSEFLAVQLAPPPCNPFPERWGGQLQLLSIEGKQYRWGKREQRIQTVIHNLSIGTISLFFLSSHFPVFFLTIS